MINFAVNKNSYTHTYSLIVQKTSLDQRAFDLSSQGYDSAPMVFETKQYRSVLNPYAHKFKVERKRFSGTMISARWVISSLMILSQISVVNTLPGLVFYLISGIG